MHQTVTKYDAIGNDIEMMYKLLSINHSCVVYAENQLNSNVSYIQKQDLLQDIGDPASVFIYHHSVYWAEGETLLKQTTGQLIFRYHNITPAYFFEPYNAHHYSQCFLGRQQTERFVRDFPKAFWLADSSYNLQDVSNPPLDRIAVCPPFNKIEQWAVGVPDEKILQQLLFSDDINLLFVGRIAPNKGHLFLFDVLRHYCSNYSRGIKLRIIGKFDDNLSSYNQELLDRIKLLGLIDCVEFIGEINDTLLLTYYLGSDFFLCASEHEGFCVPIAEAQYFQLPIIARATSAVPETIGNNQIVLGENSKEYAAAINVIYNNHEYYTFLSQNGLSNFKKRYSLDKLFTILFDFLASVL